MLESISIIIPTKNGAATLPALLAAIARQQFDGCVETIAVDSGSTDGTVALLRGRGVKVIDIPGGTFDHGLTRNVGIGASIGSLVVLLVQDAVPATDDWLSNLTSPFRTDSQLAGTFARQEPRPDAGPMTRHYLAGYFGASPVERTVCVPGADAFAALAPLERLDRCTFDNVCSCIRRSVWERHPFRATPIGEDLEWAKEVLLAGYRLAYVPSAVVVHSHERSVRYEFWRTVTLHRELFRMFELRTVPSVPTLARAWSSCVRLHGSLEWNARALGLAFAWPLGQYLGGLSAALGWPMKRRDDI